MVADLGCSKYSCCFKGDDSSEEATEDAVVETVSRELCDVDDVSESSAELRDEPLDTDVLALRCARTNETSGAL